jgi:hypothetical protein
MEYWWCKSASRFPLHNRFMWRVDVWITHIGGYPGKYNPNIKGEMASNLPNYSFVAIRIF